MSSVATVNEIALAELPAFGRNTRARAQLKERARPLYALRILCWFALIFVGGIQTWIDTQWIGGDGVSYLDIGDAYFRGDWNNAINGMWSPLYSWLTGFVLWLIKPSPSWEYPLAHLVNFALFLGALAAYEFLLSQILKAQRLPFPAWSVRILAYALFGWSALILILIRNITADYLTSIVVFLICGIFVRIRAGQRGWLTFALLGALLGLGYLGKSPMFVVAFVFMAAAFFLIKDKREALPRVLVTLVVFLLITAPFIYALSKHQGHLTFSDAGRLVYISTVNEVNQRHWQGRTVGNGYPVHPTREIFQAPPVYEFAAPVGGTYPPWFDRSYWYEGAKPHFSFRQQAKALLLNLNVFFQEVVFDLHGTLVCGLFLLLYTSKSRWSVAKSIAGHWPFLVPTLAIIGLYLIVHLEVRYIAPFVAVSALVLFLSSRPTDKRLFAGVAVTVAAGLIIVLGFFTLTFAITATRNQRNDAWRVAAGLNGLGLKPGDKIATTRSILTNAAWARLARARIVAEVYGNTNHEDRDSRRDEFWIASPSTRQQIIEALSKVGVVALVSNDVPDDADTSGWQRIASTDYYVYFLSR